MTPIKFRLWDGNAKKFTNPHNILIGANGAVRNMEYEGDNASGCVLQQFTGLLDKNGKEIYEGDILREYSFGQPCYPETQEEKELIKQGKYKKYDSRVVVPSLLSFLHEPSGSHDTAPATAEWYSEMEVIGNIFENSDQTESIFLGWVDKSELH